MVLTNIFEKSYHVGAGETDLKAMCRPSAILTFMQDAATEHANVSHMSRNELIEKHNSIWILARSWYSAKRPVFEDEYMTIRTWHRGAHGVTWYRDYELEINGEIIVQSTTAWVIADNDTRRIKRAIDFEDLKALTAVSNSSITKQLSRISTNSELTYCGNRIIRYSDLDVNAHMNNTRYADVFCDAIEFDKKENAYIGEIQINYTNECTCGDEIKLFFADEKQNTLYVEGVGEDGKNKFEIRARLET